MAKKRLNKKVAITGAVVLVVLVLAAVLVLLNMMKDPVELLAQAEVELEQVKTQLEDYRAAVAGGTETDEMVEAGQETYRKVIGKYREAFGASKDDDQKIDILFKMAEFHLTNDEFHEPEWDKAFKAWYTVKTIDPKHIEARMHVLRYYYDAGDSGASVWSRVRDELVGTRADGSDGLLRVMADKQISPDAFVVKAKARANLSLARTGQATDPASAVHEAITDFQTLLKLVPNDVEAYKFLADAVVFRDGLADQSNGDNSSDHVEAHQILQEGVDALPDNPQAYVNLLRFKLAAAGRDKDKAKKLRADFEALSEEFPSSAEVWGALSDYHQSINNIDGAIEAISHALELDERNVAYALSAISLYYHKSSVRNDNDAFETAIKIATNALVYPDAQLVSGPRYYRRRDNRLKLLSFLARLHVERALDAAEQGDNGQQKWADKAADAVGQIEQISGSPDNIYCVMWRGILALGRGQQQAAIQQMYDAYEQLNAAEKSNHVLSYMLARAFRNRPEIGSRMDFLRSAIVTDAAADDPDMLLEYAQLVLQMKWWSSAIDLVNAYETNLPATERSRGIRVSALIGSRAFDEAADVLEQMNAESGEAKSLRLSLLGGQITNLRYIQGRQPLSQEEQRQLDDYEKTWSELLTELVESHPERVTSATLAAVCNRYLADGRTDEARALVDRFLSQKPDDTTMQVYKRRLLEPEPLNVTAERLNELMLAVLRENSDPVERSLSVGRHLLRLGRPEEAIEELKEARRTAPDDNLVIESLFEAALTGRDMNLAAELADKARQMELDNCEGNFYLARLAFARSEFEDALARIDRCLEDRPVYARGHLLRSRINEALQNFDQSLADARTAAGMNPVDADILRRKAAVLHERNKRLAGNITAEQQQETEDALRAALLVSPGDWVLHSVYAEYRSKEHPDEALARLQYVQERYPNVRNYLLTGSLAMIMAQKESDAEKQESLFEIAGSAYEKADAMKPGDKEVLNHYSEYLRLTGQQDKAAGLFGGRENALADFYLRDGQYDKASEILLRLYKQDPKQPDVVRSLALIAGRTADKKGVEKYTEELLQLDTEPKVKLDDELMQIQTFVEMGLVKEAELKLASFRERHPGELRGVLLEAWVTMVNGQLAKAMDLVNRFLETAPQHAGAWRLRGKLNRIQGNYNQAVTDLQKSKSIAPSARISMELAMAYRQSNRMSAAIGELTGALQDEMAPVRVRLLLEQFYREAGRKTDLEKFYKDSIAKYADSETWYFQAAQFYIRERDLTRAEQLLEKAWEITRKKDAPVASVFDLYLEILWIAGKYQKLLDLASAYTDTPLASVAYAQMGQTQAKLGDSKAAIDYYHKALEKCGNDDALIIGILRNMEKTLGTGEVEKWVTQKLESDPESLAPNMVMFDLARSRSDFNKAVTHIDKCMSVVTASSRFYYRYAIIKANTLVGAYVKTSDKQYLSGAIKEYERILEDKPNYLSVINNLAYLLADNDLDTQRAHEYGAQAYAAAPNNPNVVDTYAYTLCKVGKYSEAREKLTAAIQLHEIQGTPIPWEVYEHLGMAHEGLEKKTDAAESYRRAIEIGGDSIDAKDRDELNDSIERVSQ